MEAHRRTRFVNNGLDCSGINRRSNGKSLPLYAVEFHYWRVDPSLWASAITNLKDTGFNAITLPTPWSIHESSQGNYDFSGPLEVSRVAQLAHQRELAVVLRLGPAVNADVNRLGFPEHVLKHEECLARTSHGTTACMPAPPRMFPLPSYAAKAFIKKSSQWLTAIAAKFAPLTSSMAEGSAPLVVAIALDNHIGCAYRNGPYDLDYHPDALKWWAEHSGDLEPPRKWSRDNASRCAQWVAFKEHYRGRALEWIAAAISDGGLDGIATFHTAPPAAPVELGLLRSGARAHSMPSFDFHGTLGTFSQTRERALYLAGSTAFPYATFATGGPVYLPPAAPNNQAAHAIAAIGAGIRGFNIIGIQRDQRWIGHSDEEDWVGKLIAIANETQLHELSRVAPVALVSSRADHRFAIASSVLGPIPSLLSGLLDCGDSGVAAFGADDDARVTASWYGAIRRALELFEIPYLIVDEATSLTRLSRFSAIICPTIRRIDAGLWEKLRAIAGTSENDTKVILGPGRPSVDALEQPLDESALVAGMGLLRPETLTDLDALGADLSAIAGPFSDDWIAADEPDVHCDILTDSLGHASLLVVVNRASLTKMATVTVPPGVKLRDGLSGEIIEASDDGWVQIELSRQSARIFIVTKSKFALK